MNLILSKRGNSWQYRFEIAKIGGRRKYFTKGGFKTKRAAVEAGTVALVTYNNTGSLFKPSEISVSDYLDYWFNTYCKMNVKYNTQRIRSSIIKNHLKPAFGSYFLKNLKPLIIQEYINQLKIDGKSKGTVISVLSTLSGALKYAVEPLNYIQTNPCANVRMPKFEKEDVARYIISPEQLDQILKRFPEPSRFNLLILTGYYTGMRIAECLALTWNDIDFKNKTISVNKNIEKRKTDTGSAWYFSTTKTKSSVRTIKIGDTLCNALKRAYERMKVNKELYGEYYTNVYKKPEINEKGDVIYRLLEASEDVSGSLEKVDMVNVRENGKPLTMDGMKYPLQVIKYKLHIPFNFHSLRHTHATILIANGANIKDVQERLGHSSIQTTLNTYMHNTDELRSLSVDIFEKAVNKKRTSLSSNE